MSMALFIIKYYFSSLSFAPHLVQNSFSGPFSSPHCGQCGFKLQPHLGQKDSSAMGAPQLGQVLPVISLITLDAILAVKTDLAILIRDMPNPSKTAPTMQTRPYKTHIMA